MALGEGLSEVCSGCNGCEICWQLNPDAEKLLLWLRRSKRRGEKEVCDSTEALGNAKAHRKALVA